MRLSIRNQLSGVVAQITRGRVMASVRVRLAGGDDMTAVITLEAVDDLQLAEGTEVTVIVKATEVAVATGPVGAISIRNRIPGRVEAVDHGLVITTVKVGIAGDAMLTAAITLDAAVDRGLAAGSEVTLLVKSTEVSLGLE